MPTDQATAREARLVKAVAKWLRDQGTPCTIAGWPDRDPGKWPNGLTVEAVLAIGPAGAQRNWAADVMTVPVPPGVAEGMNEATQQLLAPAAALAAQAHRAVTISIRSQAGSKGDREAYYKRVLALVEEAFRTGHDYYDASGEDPVTQVVLLDGEFFGDPSGAHGAERVRLATATGNGANVLAELQQTLPAPLDKKLSNQLNRAKTLGYPTVLILDQLGNEAMPAGTNWLPSADAIRTVIGQCDAAHPGVLDSAVLAGRDGSLTQVFGSIV